MLNEVLVPRPSCCCKVVRVLLLPVVIEHRIVDFYEEYVSEACLREKLGVLFEKLSHAVPFCLFPEHSKAVREPGRNPLVGSIHRPTLQMDLQPTNRGQAALGLSNSSRRNQGWNEHDWRRTVNRRRHAATQVPRSPTVISPGTS